MNHHANIYFKILKIIRWHIYKSNQMPQTPQNAKKKKKYISIFLNCFQNVSVLHFGCVFV